MIHADPPAYYCVYTKEPVVVDGRLDERFWQHVPPLILGNSYDGSGGSPRTIVRACWTDHQLLVAFECEDEDIWGTHKERDAPLYDEEVVEVFLSPTGDVRSYFEIEVSPHNVVFDAAIHNPDLNRETMVTELAWTCSGLRTAVAIDGVVHDTPPRSRSKQGPRGHWSVEMAIPFSALGLEGPPTPGAEWRVNFYRIDRGRREAYLAWSPTVKKPADFHVPDRFGALRFTSVTPEMVVPGQWSIEKAIDWYRMQPWMVGCNFIPSTAVNQLEMWQAATFSPDDIDRELRWAASLGMNVVRVYLHDRAWFADPAGFRERMRQYLTIAFRHGIRTIFVLFDDCWNPEAQIGPQPSPVPGVHNSRWLQSPGVSIVNDPSRWERLAAYVRDVIGSFARDRRILMWDLYNEPGNSSQGNKSLPLLLKAFEWARSVSPTQPLTAGVWADLPELNAVQVINSDIITFHNYQDTASLSTQISDLRRFGRPLVCTEWMARPTSTIATHLPIFKQHNVGCVLWGLVAGKTQTIYPWGSPEGAPEPTLWFHDLLRADGTPLDAGEIQMLREMTRGRRSWR